MTFKKQNCVELCYANEMTKPVQKVGRATQKGSQVPSQKASLSWLDGEQPSD